MTPKSQMFKILIYNVFVLCGRFFNHRNCFAEAFSDTKIDLEPHRGMGYSSSTGKRYATCLNLSKDGLPSLNYDYYFMQVTSPQTVNDDLRGKVSQTQSFEWLQSEIAADYEKIANGIYTHYVILVLTTNSNGHGIMYNALSPEAVRILDKKDYVGFFLTCGPGYINDVTKAAELITVFSYESPIATLSERYALAIIHDATAIIETGYTPGEISIWASPHSWESSSHLRQRAVGLSLGNSDKHLAANNLNEIMMSFSHALDTMKHRDSGVTTGIEIIPWSKDIEFNNKVGKPLSQLQLYNLDANAEFINMVQDTLTEKMVSMQKKQKCIDQLNMFVGVDDNTLVRNWAETTVLSTTPTCATGAFNAVTDLDTIHVGRLRTLLMESSVADQLLNIRDWVNNFMAPCLTDIRSDDDIDNDTQNETAGKIFTTVWFSSNSCNKLRCLEPYSKIDSATNADCTGKPAKEQQIDEMAERNCPVILSGSTCS